MMNTASYDYLIKLIIVGDTAVGKTSLLLRFTENQVCSDHIATIGMNLLLFLNSSRNAKT